MKSVYNFVVTPVKSRYNNTKNIGGKELIVNTEIFNHQYVSREAIVKAIPTVGDTDIKVGDKVIVHHNVFRRWHNQHGIEKNSRSYIDEETYLSTTRSNILIQKYRMASAKRILFCSTSKIYRQISVDKEKPLVGIVKHTDGTVNKGDLIGFRPSSEYEFIIDGQKLYRVLIKFYYNQI
jgi:hypothetical protein